MLNNSLEPINQQMEHYTWYHTIDLGERLFTPGIYDHRPYLGAYGLPKDLTGRSALDIGAASGFFTFELEKRHAQVTSTELPDWMSHDFGPLYQPDMTPAQAEQYLHAAYDFAHRRLASQAKRKLINIYDISPESVGVFDLVLCGSVLLHLTDPIKALWRIQSVTKEAAIIATVIHPLQTPEPLALFLGANSQETWWWPNRAGFEALIKSAGFRGWEWFSEFRLDFRDGESGPYHAVIRAWNTPERPAILDDTDQPPANLVSPLAVYDSEVKRLRELVDSYEKTRAVRLTRRLQHYRQKLQIFITGKNVAR